MTRLDVHWIYQSGRLSVEIFQISQYLGLCSIQVLISRKFGKIGILFAILYVHLMLVNNAQKLKIWTKIILGAGDFRESKEN